MKPKVIYSIACMLVLVITCASCSLIWRDKFKQGEEVISKIEDFRKEKGRLPDSLAELGMEETESGPIYYQKLSDTKYEIWFTTGVGDSMRYDSDSKKWRASS